MSPSRSFAASFANSLRKLSCKSFALRFLLSTKSVTVDVLTFVSESWVSGLPFKPVVWDALSPKVIRKLILDVGQPVYFDLYDYNPVYISCEEMKPLTKFTLLEELRILHIYKGVQPIVWKTVYGNKVGMQILELQMAEPPLTEREINWTQADKVMGLKVSQDNVHKYK